MKVSYNWLKEYIDDELPSVEKVAEALTMHSFEIEGVEEVEGDRVMDVKVLPNRAHDCLCHLGIVSEVASVLKLKRKELLREVVLENHGKISVNINTKNCSRQMMILVSGVEVKESPDWLKEKLKVLGSRSINNVVDLTNYLTFAFGQPMHAFDAAKVSQNKKGEYEFNIRDANKGEKITLLDGKEYELLETNMVIADTSIPLDVAGVMGGKDSGVSFSTTDIIFSLSSFDPISVRKTAKKLGIRTDASYRFENEIHQKMIDRVLPYLVKNISEVVGGEIVSTVDINKEKVSQTEVSVTTDKINKMLGIEISSGDAMELLSRQNIVAEEIEEGIKVFAPFERLDIKIPEDVVEEVGRIYGYENIKPVMPSIDANIQINLDLYISDSIRKILGGLGYTEIYTYAFGTNGELELENPLSEDKKFMRANLSTSMEEALEKNFKYMDLLGIKDVKLFEIGKVFKTKGEMLHLCLGVKQPKSKHSMSLDEEIAKTIQEVERTLGVSIGDVSIMSGVAEFNLERIKTEIGKVENYPVDLWRIEEKNISYKTISPFPFAVRDVAVFVPNEVSVEVVESLIKEKFKDFVIKHSLFDKFTKGEKTSYAYRIIFQANDRTLTEEEINGVMNPIYETLKAQEGFEIR